VDRNISTIKRNTGVLLDAGKGVDVKIYTELSVCSCLVIRLQAKIVMQINKSLKNTTKFKYLCTVVTN